MSKSLGKCPFCDTGLIETRPVTVDGAPVKLYACSNAQWVYVADMWELSKDATCSFKIFSNQLRRYGKRSIGEREIRTLLSEGQVEVRLYNKKAREPEYFKYLIADKEYGTSIIWD